MYTIHQQQQHLQQAMFAQQQQQQQQQEANLLFHQYNQLRSMQAAYSNPALASVTYGQQPIDPQQQQLYRPDQLVPQIPTPIQQQMQPSEPINMIPMSSSNVWLTGSPIPLSNSQVFRPIPHTTSLTMLDLASYHNRTNSISSEPSTPPMSTSFESTRHYYSNQQSSPKNHRQRERLHSGSSCYESDSPDFSSDNEDEFEVSFPWRFI